MRVVTAVLCLGLLASQAAAATLRVASVDWPPGLGNPYGSLAQATSHTRAAIYDGLTHIGVGGVLEPALALTWTATNASTWRFTLRPNVVFSNGEPFNAAAVKAVFDYLATPPGSTQLLTQETREIRAVRVIDDLTVDIETVRTDAVLPKRLSLIMMVPPKAWAAAGPEGFAVKPIGTGAYLLKDWGRSTGRTIIEANATSWRKPIAIDRVELMPLKEPVARAQALRSGQVDVTQGLGHEDIADLRAEGFQIDVEPDAQIMAIALRNVGNPGSPLQDVRVRQALNYAVDKVAIAHDLLHDTVQPAGQGAIPGVAGYNPDVKPYPYDPAKAKALLAEAGYPNGLKLTARVQAEAVVAGAAIYSEVAANLKAAGINVEMRPVAGPDWVRMYTSGNWGAADMISVTWNAASFGDVIRAIETFSCDKPGAFFCAPELTPLIEASNAQLDPARRDRQLQEIMARFHELAPSLYLVNIATILAASPRVGPLVYSRAGLLFERMRLIQ